MANPLFNQLNPNQGQPQQNTFSDFINFVNTFRGDPKAVTDQLIQSGRMSQDQFDSLYKAASNILGRSQ